jgi:hypothetical protein
MNAENQGLFKAMNAENQGLFKALNKRIDLFLLALLPGTLGIIAALIAT